MAGLSVYADRQERGEGQDGPEPRKRASEQGSSGARLAGRGR